PPPPTETPTEMPAPPLLGPPISASISISPTIGIIGTVVAVNGQGWPPGEPVYIALVEPGADLSQAVKLEHVRATAGPDGVFSATFAFPPDARWWARPEVFVIAHSEDWATIATATFTLSVQLLPFDKGESGYPLEAPSYRVFNSADEWHAFLGEFGGAVSPPPPELGPIWEEEILIGVFAGAQPTSGYTANISSVLRYGSQVHVNTQLIPPAPDAPVTQGATYPYHLVKLRRAELMRGPASFLFYDGMGNLLAQVDVTLP
ncbi:MAG: protease complex subunit PrcB family protein, partial [Anaerolineae bacterium]